MIKTMWKHSQERGFNKVSYSAKLDQYFSNSKMQPIIGFEINLEWHNQYLKNKTVYNKEY